MRSQLPGRDEQGKYGERREHGGRGERGVIVGIDARKLHDGGIGTYIRQLLLATVAARDDERFVAFVRPADAGAAVPLPAFEAGLAREVVVRAGRYSLGEHVELPRAASAAGVDLFHAPHYTLPIGWRGPAIVTVHDLIHLRFPEFFPPGAALYARTVAGRAVRRARLVLVDSSHTRDDVERFLGIKGDRVRVVPLGVSQAFRRRPAEAVRDFLRARHLPAGFVLYVGARKRHKNLALLMSALARSRSGAPLVLAGKPWAESDPLALAAREAGLHDRVAFSGSLDGEEELSLLYSGAALYAQPSLDEGFGLPPLEAMACGTPVLAAAAGALPETLGDAAVLLPPRDPEAWAAALDEMLGDARRRDEMAARGFARAREFLWERTVEKTFAAYREAVSS